MIAVKLSERESWVKLVTSNYCTCDLWTTLLLGSKTFPIIEEFFFFFGFEFRPHSIIPITWNQYNIYSHTSSTYHSVQEHRWLVDWATKTHPPSTPVENCHPCWSCWPRRIGALTSSPHSLLLNISTSVSVDSLPRPSLFTSATVWIPVHTTISGFSTVF